MSDSQPEIVNHTDQPLDDAVEEILSDMFAGYRQLIVHRPFTSGLSGSQVFPIRPIGHNNELPFVFKFDNAAQISQEWQAYQNHIQYQLPQMARIRSSPVYSPDGQHGGLCYEMAGNGIFTMESFATFYQTYPIEDIQKALARLFTNMSPLWQLNQRTEVALFMQTQYDSFLPVNLWLKRLPAPAGVTPRPYQPHNCHQQQPQIGDFVALSGFQVVEIKGDELVLNSPKRDHRLILQGVDVTAYQIGQQLDQPITTAVKQTRASFLQAQVKQFMPNLDPTAVALPRHPDLKNPLPLLPTVLKQSFDAKVGLIHGDLNLQNILIDVQNYSVYLIDFALARKDHLLRDLLHLEMSIVTHFLSADFVRQGLDASAIEPFYRQLHAAVVDSGQTSPPAGLEKPFAVLQTIRQTARAYLYHADDWKEYYNGLFIYLLGSLRFKSLDQVPLAKELAFWATAVVHQLSINPPMIKQETVKPTTPDPASAPASQPQPNQVVQNQTNFYGPISGSTIHSGTSTQLFNPKPQSAPPPYSGGNLFNSYERGVEKLILRLGTDHANHSDALNLQNRLRENVNRTQRYGDTNNRKADRAEIIDYLNQLTLSTLGISFNDLCQKDHNA